MQREDISAPMHMKLQLITRNSAYFKTLMYNMHQIDGTFAGNRLILQGGISYEREKGYYSGI